MTKTDSVIDAYVPKNCEEAYGIINNRQITALMFHDSMADMFDFLGLKGFKRMHEYQYLVESVEHRAIKRYYLNHHGKMLPESKVSSISVVPADWYKYNRMDVTISIRKQAVQTALEKYLDWETETKAVYSKVASYLMEWNKVADFNRVNTLLMDVDRELKALERLCLQLQSVDYDPVYMDSIQCKYHDRYKKMAKKIGVSIC